MGMEILSVVVLGALLVGLILLAVGTAGIERRERQRITARLATIENKLDAVIAHLGAVVPEPAYPEVENLLRNDRLIDAVRAYRAETGADLLTAKQAVDAIAARLRA
ncbi:hypothetical protein ACPCHT_32765 [Nucisporomicrobium flavum]|jgi:hypothetical protein|uniref:hypothetical protein n=1 Tax=Nucisporomicrobium flavum TaxID=2785915 RepID=UPI001F242BAC|nr:hypothetical protein [Nucisporomicrobium flavum]